MSQVRLDYEDLLWLLDRCLLDGKASRERHNAITIAAALQQLGRGGDNV